MKLIEAKAEDLAIRRNRRSENFELLMQFADSEMECAEVTDHTFKSANTLCQSLQHSIKHYNIGFVRVVKRYDRVFLVKGGKTV